MIRNLLVAFVAVSAAFVEAPRHHGKAPRSPASPAAASSRSVGRRPKGGSPAAAFRPLPGEHLNERELVSILIGVLGWLKGQPAKHDRRELCVDTELAAAVRAYSRISIIEDYGRSNPLISLYEKVKGDAFVKAFFYIKYLTSHRGGLKDSVSHEHLVRLAGEYDDVVRKYNSGGRITTLHDLLDEVHTSRK